MHLETECEEPWPSRVSSSDMWGEFAKKTGKEWQGPPTLPEEACGADTERKIKTFDQGSTSAWGTSGKSDAQETSKSLNKWE